MLSEFPGDGGEKAAGIMKILAILFTMVLKSSEIDRKSTKGKSTLTTVGLQTMYNTLTAMEEFGAVCYESTTLKDGDAFWPNLNHRSFYTLTYARSKKWIDSPARELVNEEKA
jgi:Fe2+ or Zn2+ uptake regulation protein